MEKVTGIAGSRLRPCGALSLLACLAVLVGCSKVPRSSDLEAGPSAALTAFVGVGVVPMTEPCAVLRDQTVLVQTLFERELVPERQEIPVSEDELIERVLTLSPQVRYVAVYRDGQLLSGSREGLAAPSSSESDRYEELLVNPTLLLLARQRGDIDCGGAAYVLVRYGNFFQLITPIRGGHVSVAVEPHADPLALAAQVADVLRGGGFSGRAA
jgi:hypothetical protein